MARCSNMQKKSWERPDGIQISMALSVLLLGAWFTSGAEAQDIKLYAFSSGALTLGKGYLQNGAPMTPQIQVPVGFFVVMHPKGNVLFDTGNNDKIITDPSYWGASFQALKPVNTPDVAVDAQLQKIGLSPMTLSTSQSATSTRPRRKSREVPRFHVVVQKSEIQNAFGRRSARARTTSSAMSCRCARR